MIPDFWIFFFLTGAKTIPLGGSMKSLILMFLTLAIAAGMVTAAEMREIELTDGTILTGEIVSLTGGVYTVRSATLGTVRGASRRRLHTCGKSEVYETFE